MWTDDRVALLKELNDQGSNSWIAFEINKRTGSNFTRNAIIGKRNREGLPTPNKPTSQKKTLPKKKPAARVRTNWTTWRRSKSTEPDMETLATVNLVPQDFMGLSILEVGKDQCRYPRGGDNGEPITFCGQPVKEDSSYCPYCHSLVYVKPKRSPEDYVRMSRFAA